LANDPSGGESSTYSLGSVPGDLVATLDATVAQQGSTIHVTKVTDGGGTVSDGVSYAWQVSSDAGLHWTTVGHDSSYTPAAADAGDLLQVVVTYVDSGDNESTVDSLGLVASAKEWKGDAHPWEVDGQWSPSGVPTSTDDVVVNGSGESTYTLTIDQASVAQSLVVNDSKATVEIVDGGNLTLGGNLTIEAGKFQIDAGGTLTDTAASATIIGAFTDNGTVEAAGTTLEVASTSISGNGKFKIDAGATLQIDHADSLDVVFGGSGKLILLDPAHFSGTISDSGGSMTASDVLDVAGFDTSASVTYNGTTSSGTVTIQETGHVAVVLKVGANSTNWSAPVDDGHGGILIHDPPADGSAPMDATSNVAESNAAVPNGFAANGDGFVFRPNIGNDLAADHVHSRDSIQIDPSHLATALLAAINGDGHGNTIFTADAVGGTFVSDLLKAQLSAHHSDFHFV
jgi:hypothetical protein